jgi:hypothetical protein
LKERRKRLKKGTVIGTWKDDNGQWWQNVVVRDTAKAFKSLAQKIDPPSGGDDKAEDRR